MRKVGFIVVAVLAVVLLAGCPAFFEVNLFQPLDLITLPTAEKLNSMSTEEALAYLSRELDSPRFIEKLRDDAAARTAVENYLAAQTGIPPLASKGFSIEDLVDWHLLDAVYHLRMYYGEELINNVANLVFALTEDAWGTEDDVRAFLVDFLENIVPSSVKDNPDDPEPFYDMLDSFQEIVWPASVFVAENCFDGDPNTPPQNLPADFNKGDFAQRALFAWLISMALTPDAIWQSEDDAKAALWHIVSTFPPTPPVQPPGTGAAFTDPFEVGHTLHRILSELGILGLFEAP